MAAVGPDNLSTSEDLATVFGRVAFAYVQGANPKAGAHLGFASDVIRARLWVIGGKRTPCELHWEDITASSS